jgi:hypothetical protein
MPADPGCRPQARCGASRRRTSSYGCKAEAGRILQLRPSMRDLRWRRASTEHLFPFITVIPGQVRLIIMNGILSFFRQEKG